MSAHLHRLNFVLLLALGALCVFQWSTEKSARARIGGLLKTQEEQARRLAEQTESLQASAQDLEAFRTQILGLKSQVDGQAATIRTQNSQIARLDTVEASLTRQLEIWKKAVDDYHGAVEARDAQIATLVDQRDRFYEANKASIQRANAAVASLNDLNEKYSDVVTRYNDLAAKTQAQTPAPASPGS
jgi:chromosome segregation ATPase